MSRFSPRTQGILWELNAALAFVLLTSLVKFVSTALPTPIIALFRVWLSFFFVVPLALKKGVVLPQRSSLPWYLVYALISCFAVNATFYAYKHLPLSIATVVGYTEPMIQVFFSILFFKASVQKKDWVFILLGYCGVFLIAYTKYDPQDGVFTTALLIALFASVLINMAKVASKHLTQKETPHQVILYSTLLNGFFSLAFLYFAATPWPSPLPALHMIGLLPAISFLGFITQYSFTKALSLADMHVLSPITYLRLVFALPIGYCCYGELPGWATLVGSAIILIANYGLLLPKKRSQKIDNVSS